MERVGESLLQLLSGLPQEVLPNPSGDEGRAGFRNEFAEGAGCGRVLGTTMRKLAIVWGAMIGTLALFWVAQQFWVGGDVFGGERWQRASAVEIWSWI